MRAAALTEPWSLNLVRDAGATDVGYASAREAGSDTMVSMVTPSRTAGVVLLCNNQVLLVLPGEASRHEKGVWGLPAGHLDDGETTRDAAIRETEEETGLTLQAVDLVELPDTYTETLGRRGETPELMTWTVFAAEKFSGTLRETAETSPFWVNLTDLADLHLQKNVGNAITQARQVMGSRSGT